ncbi:putative cytotoxic protein [Lachnotalea glycerini]|uniref:Putative cytotoxic protein n=1 Tax=Lachnotalea glycerini TaxID=1763509 RepID=A0A318EG02_9FIRM|nr:putative cytotoxic protein [Lachnotalea glycerini]
MTVAGTAETVAGGIGDIFGAVISMSGAGAAAGIPTIAISTDVLITGIAEMAYGISISMTATDNLAGDIKKAQEAAENTDVSKGGSETVGEFEKRISKMSPNERVAAVKEKASKVAKEKNLVKDSKLSKRNGRDIYKDPKTGEYYAVDSQHGRFEHLNKRGKHIGEVDFDFNSTKSADSSGGHDIYVK